MNLAKPLLAGLSGALFTVGLGIAGMTRPENVIAFLDVGGAWDPSLAFVMVGAIAVYAVLFRVVSRRSKPLFDTAFQVPTTKKVDAKLVTGAALFGLGWGIAGYCPGPGLASISFLPGAVFVGSMIAGFLLVRWRDGFSGT